MDALDEFFRRHVPGLSPAYTLPGGAFSSGRLEAVRPHADFSAARSLVWNIDSELDKATLAA